MLTLAASCSYVVWHFAIAWVEMGALCTLVFGVCGIFTKVEDGQELAVTVVLAITAWPYWSAIYLDALVAGYRQRRRR